MTRNEAISALEAHATAIRACGATGEDAPTFLANPHPMLGGRTPLEAATTDVGARNVERILSAIEAGLPV